MFLQAQWQFRSRSDRCDLQFFRKIELRSTEIIQLKLKEEQQCHAAVECVLAGDESRGVTEGGLGAGELVLRVELVDGVILCAMN